MEKYYCVILAGGIGSRLWPVSRHNKPKQFLDLFGTGRTLLQQTYDRFAKIITPENIYVSTNMHYKELVCEQLPELKPNQILTEPIRRNTLPSVAWATAYIAHLNPNASIVVTPADQLILKEDVFRQDILNGLDFVSEQNMLLTMGVKPTRPDTGYGYIQAGETMKEPHFARVKSFTEKPALDFARMFMESGEFYWNTGLFLWNVKTMLHSIHDVAPEYIQDLIACTPDTPKDLSACIPEHFSALPNLSLDYGILERSENVCLQICGFGWADLGSWNSLHDDAQCCKPQDNVLMDSKALLYNSTGNIIRMPKDRVAVIDGLNNFVVAEEGNVLMICPKNDAAALRRIMTDAQMKLGEEFS